MGFSVRDHKFRYTVWLPWNGTVADWNATGQKLEELYDYGSDDGSDFDAMDTVNLAYEPTHLDVAKVMFDIAREFFHVIVPPSPPSPGPSPGPASPECEKAGGISAHDGIACCPKTCGQCGGTDCGKAPGGKMQCCKGEVEKNGRDCKTDVAPCNVNAALLFA